MTRDNNRYAGVAVGIALAALAGFGVARITTPSVPATETTDTAAKPSAADVVEITPDAVSISGIKVAPASDENLSGLIMASATVEATPDAEAVLTARAAGTVTRIFKRIGDPVKAGEAIAFVESREAAGIAAQRSSSAARAALASRQLERERDLLEKGVSARADFEAAESNLAVAQAEARQAEASARASGLSDDGRTVAVVSSIDGRITSASATLGSFVQAEKELFRVADPTRLQIEASVPPGDATRVRAGDRVELRTNDGKTMEGRVRSETGVVDVQTRQSTIVIVPAADGGSMVPGQLVQARIYGSGEQSDKTVTVPQDAVQTLGQRTVVFVRTESGFKAQTIQVKGRSGGMVGISSGLSPGAIIATTNAFLLKAELEKETAE